jgi:hypothetical protein
MRFPTESFHPYDGSCNTRSMNAIIEF